ncbi:MAG TPA: Ig-like domain-containing protein, partial [Acidimicrobiia bacterium]
GDDGEVSMLGAGVLGGGGLLFPGLAAAGLGTAALIGGGSGGGDSSGPQAPYVNDPDANFVIGGDEDEPTLTVTGGGEPGDEVKVTVGDKEVETVIDEDGEFEAVFEGDNFPGDGAFDSEVVVTNPDGENTDLDGPSFEIDLTPPELVFTDGTESTGDFFNQVTFGEGVTLSGTGEAGATVAVTIADVTRTTVVSETGSWSVTWETGTLEAGEYTTGITAVTTDSFGNSRSYSDTLVVDTVNVVTVDEGVSTTIDGVRTVGDGVINGVEHEAGATFTGTAQAGSSVVVTIGTVSTTVTATADGTWSASFASSQLASGEYDGTVSVVSTDTYGNVANATGEFEVDTFVRDFAITSSTGGADGVINAEESANALTVSGTTEPGSTVTVELGGITVPAVVAADGSWTATFAAGSVASGTYTATMTATATDAAGNVDTATTSVQVDTEAGLLTIDSTPVEGDDVVNEVEASDGVVLTGTADAGAVVTVTMAGVSHDVVTKADGTWEAFFSASEVAPGVYTADITATTTDPYGNSRSATDSVEVDTRVDNLSLAADDIATDNIISALEHDGNVTVTGTTEVGSTSVVVTLGTQTASATIDAAGNWSAVFDASALPTGTYTADVKAVATDAAGNTKPVTGTVDIDTEVKPFEMTSNSAGPDQVVNAAEAAAGIDLGGIVEAGSTVNVVFDGKSYSATVDAAGNWSLTVPASDIRGGEYDASIKVTATDHVGNVAVINETLTIDTTAPDGPIIASVDQAVGGFRGITIETTMEDGVPASDTP